MASVARIRKAEIVLLFFVAGVGLSLASCAQIVGHFGAVAVDPDPSPPVPDPSPPVPGWVMRAKAQVVDALMPLETVKTRAISELQTADLPERHLPAEQLAAAAIQNLQAGRAADAALWLSLASYRYTQEWNRILRTHIGNARPGSLPAAFYQLGDLELHVYRDLSFESQLSALARYLRGEDMVDWDLHQRLTELFRDGPVDEETLAEVVRRKMSTRSGAPEEAPAATDLSEAYLRHLHAGAEQKRYSVFAVRALRDTPLAPFSFEALRWGLKAFNPRFCSTLANQLSTHRKEVAAFLSDAKGETRANAAVIMGMNPDPDQVPRLEQLWASEKQRSVRLALAYALVRHGQQERIGELTKALAPCPGDVCDEAMALLDWLPDDLKAALDSEIVAKLAGDFRQTLTVRLFAAATLGGIAAKRSLSPQSREILIAVSREKNRDLSTVATVALARDVGFSREIALAALKNPSPAYRPLLTRLSRVARAEDLPVLAQLMPRFATGAGSEAVALIETAARVPGVDAEALLLSWFEAHRSLRAHIAFQLMARPKVERETVLHLDAASDRDVHLIVRVMARAPGALALLKEDLRSGQPRQRLFAAFLAGAVGDPRTKQDLWSLVNFRDDRLYPNDARLRHAAMGSLLWIALAEMVAVRTPAAAPPSVLTMHGALSQAWSVAR